MNERLRYSYFDFAKAIGEKKYIIADGAQFDLSECFQKSPVAQGVLGMGPSFLLFGNVKTWKTMYVSDECYTITGYSTQEAKALGPQFLVNITHSDDYPIAMAANEKAVKVLYDAPIDDRPYLTCVFYHRGIRKDGSPMHIMQQIIPFAFDIQGNPYVFAMVISDISLLEMSRKPRICLIDHKRNDYRLIDPGISSGKGERVHFSTREKEVLGLLADGFTTREISAKMNISFHTAATYRKRLREKSGVSTTGALVNFALVHSII